jgi:hypothetical protein
MAAEFHRIDRIFRMDRMRKKLSNDFLSNHPVHPENPVNFVKHAFRITRVASPRWRE